MQRDDSPPSHHETLCPSFAHLAVTETYFLKNDKLDCNMPLVEAPSTSNSSPFGSELPCILPNPFSVSSNAVSGASTSVSDFGNAVSGVSTAVSDFGNAVSDVTAISGFDMAASSTDNYYSGVVGGRKPSCQPNSENLFAEYSQPDGYGTHAPFDTSPSQAVPWGTIPASSSSYHSYPCSEGFSSYSRGSSTNYTSSRLVPHENTFPSQFPTADGFHDYQDYGSSLTHGSWYAASTSQAAYVNSSTHSSEHAAPISHLSHTGDDQFFDPITGLRRRLHQLPPQTDPVLERRRRSAIGARKRRQEVADREGKLNQNIDQISKEVEELKKERGDVLRNIATMQGFFNIYQDAPAFNQGKK